MTVFHYQAAATGDVSADSKFPKYGVLLCITSLTSSQAADPSWFLAPPAPPDVSWVQLGATVVGTMGSWRGLLGAGTVGFSFLTSTLPSANPSWFLASPPVAPDLAWLQWMGVSGHRQDVLPSDQADPSWFLAPPVPPDLSWVQLGSTVVGAMGSWRGLVGAGTIGYGLIMSTPPAGEMAQLVATLATGTVTPFPHTFPLPPEVLALLTTAYYPAEIAYAPALTSLDLLRPTWRTDTGVPTVATQEVSSLPFVRVTPSPIVQGLMGIPGLSGIPGAPSLNNNLVFFLLLDPDPSTIPDWVEGLLAYRLAAREARRPGEGQDATVAAALEQVVAWIDTMLVALWNDEGLETSTRWAPYTVRM